jgi:predicted lipoprotein with Yx(FWY)xxD motif
VSDGAGGAIITWVDSRSGSSIIYAQRISSAGGTVWTANGISICTSLSQNSVIVADGSGGAIIAWEDLRGGTYYNIYAQRVTSSGECLWTPGGVRLCGAGRSQQYPALVADGTGGAIVAWDDGRSGSSVDIYAQRISAAGTVQWTANGSAVCNLGQDQERAAITSDGAGGAVVAWHTYQNGYSNADIYAQRISADGTVQWTVNGTPVCAAYGSQGYPAIATDGAGGAIVAWPDPRNTDMDIYAQRIQANGELGGVADVPLVTPLTFALDPVRPNPSRSGTLTVHFSLPTDAPARLELIDVAGRRIASHDVGMSQHTLDLGTGQRLAPGLYLVRLTQGANTRTTRAAVLK